MPPLPPAAMAAAVAVSVLGGCSVKFLGTWPAAAVSGLSAASLTVWRARRGYVPVPQIGVAGTAVAATVGGAVAAGGLLASRAGDRVAFAEWSLWSGAVVTLAIAHRVVNKTHCLTACLLKKPPLCRRAQS